MKTTAQAFKEQQEKSIKLLERLKAFLLQGEEAGQEIDPSLKDKIYHAIKETNGQKLRVALIGGFSEGKTSIAAAWLEKLDKSTMKIDHRESSDEVAFYSVGDDIELVDTPGLFGFKSKNEGRENELKYKDITKKYVSQAHLVLYVVDSDNAIKDTHQEELKWLFRVLNLLPRTIFVLGKFDLIADLEDQEEYNRLLAIKQEDVRKRLKEVIKLSKEEIQNLSIVAVAANPLDAGVEYWIEHMEEFKKLSHIAQLQEATLKKIEENNGFQAIIQEAKKSVIADILNKMMPKAKEANEEIKKIVKEHQNIQEKTTQELKELEEKINTAQIRLKACIESYIWV